MLRPQVATAGVHAFVRFGSAAFVSEKLAEFRKRPEQPIILYGELERPVVTGFCQRHLNDVLFVKRATQHILNM